MAWRTTNFDLVVIVCALVYGCVANDGICASEDKEEPDSLFLLQTQSQLMVDARNAKALKSAVGANAEPTLHHAESCADLHNRGSYFSVPVTVGTSIPGQEQRFELVADTGSSAVIVTSCACVETGYCSPEDNCFTGTHHSPTFNLSLTTDHHGKNDPTMVAMTFGSGTVSAIIASDVVQVDSVKVNMLDGLMLMVDRSELQISGPFEGILGLGIESKEEEEGHSGANRLHAKESNDLSSNGMPAWRPQSPKQTKVRSSRFGPDANSTQLPKTKVFLKEAGVDRFSLCFNDEGESGALRLNIPPLPDALPAIGSFHWGLGLYGFSVGDENEPSFLCHHHTMKQGQKTPCGMIPDSGTTLMMGPADHIVSLFENLCDRWERCRTAHSTGLLHHMSNRTHHHHMSKSHTFQTLLYGCSTWMTSDDDINEVPSIFITVGGPAGKKVLELTAWAYITESLEQEYASVVKHLQGIIPVVMDVPVGKPHKVCSPSFGVQDYNTADNGPAWIMGMPLFYQFIVGYDLAGPSISFSKGTCSSCHAHHVNLMSSEKTSSGPRALRRASGTPRTPEIDTSSPL